MSRCRRWNSRGRWSRTVVYAMTYAMIVVAAGTLPLCADEEELPQQAPEVTLPNLEGTEISLSDYLGHVIILDFWASWCAPCIRALPNIHALVETYAEQGVVLFLLCFDKSAEDARSYLIENEYATDNVLWGSLKDARAVRDLFGVNSVTHTVVIGPDGYIRYSGHPEKVTADVLEPWLPEAAQADGSEDEETEGSA